jgi:tripartite-type tricarboxylate transporter receptor subunit TctC
MIITTDIMPFVMIQRKNAPWGLTLAGMVEYGKANPGKLRYISIGVGSSIDITGEWLMQTFGVKVQKIPVGTHQECASTIGAGEGDFGVTTLDVAITNWQINRVDVIAVLGGEAVPDIWSKNPNIVTKVAGIDTTLVGTTFGLGVPSQVPQAHVDWLYKLFKAGATSDMHLRRAKMYPGLTFKIVDGAAANRANQKILDTFDPVVRALGLHVDDVK